MSNQIENKEQNNSLGKVDVGLGNLTIASAVNHVANADFLLPTLQRDYVWTAERVEDFFDSLYRGYPIGSLILLPMSEHDKDIALYMFRKDSNKEEVFATEYVTKENRRNGQFLTMDGQQRLTSLYVARNKKWLIKGRFGSSHDDYLCFNVLAKDAIDADERYFRFKRAENKINLDVEDDTQNELWVDVRYLIDKDFNLDDFISSLQKFEKYDLDPNEGIPLEIFDYEKLYVTKKGITKFADTNYAKVCKTFVLGDDTKHVKGISEYKNKIERNINKFKKMWFEEELISYNCLQPLPNDMDSKQKIERIYDIFERLNSGGMPLGPADLLFSKIAKDAKGFKVREEFTNYCEQLNAKPNPDGKKFKFNPTYIVRSVWHIFGGSLFKAFAGSDDVKSEKKYYDDVVAALIKARNCFVDTGFEPKSLSNMLMPIAYYFYYGGKDSEDAKREIGMFYIVSFFSGYFGRSGDSVLWGLRQAMSKAENNEKKEGIELFDDKVFNFKKLQVALESKSKTNRLKITTDNIKDMLERGYDTDYTNVRSVLVMLNGDWQVADYKRAEDHIHPKYCAKDSKDEVANTKIKAIDKYAEVVKREGCNFDYEEYKFFKKNCNKFGNIQLLTRNENTVIKKDKSLVEYLALKSGSELEETVKKHFIPHELLKDEIKADFDVDIDKDIIKLANFRKFYHVRRLMLYKALCEKFDITILPNDKFIEEEKEIIKNIK